MREGRHGLAPAPDIPEAQALVIPPGNEAVGGGGVRGAAAHIVAVAAGVRGEERAGGEVPVFLGRVLYGGLG